VDEDKHGCELGRLPFKLFVMQHLGGTVGLKEQLRSKLNIITLAHRNTRKFLASKMQQRKGMMQCLNGRQRMPVPILSKL
jgi:hypothetical protein